jgi:DNA repair exonuclease SbcCD nuclease subunit
MYMHSPDSAATIMMLKELNHISLAEINGAVVGSATEPLIITGVRWGAQVPKDPPRASRAPHVMIIHAPIAEAPVFERHDYIDARGFAEKHRGYDLILCGDIHRHFCVRTKWNVIVNTGPMMRREATEYNFIHEPCFYVWDTETKELIREIIPHRPAEEILSRKHLEVQQDIKTLLSDFVEKVKKTLSKEAPGVDVMANFKRAFETLDLPASTKELIMEVVNDSKGE